MDEALTTKETVVSSAILKDRDETDALKVTLKLDIACGATITCGATLTPSRDLQLLVNEALSYTCMRPSANSVCGLKLQVYEALSY